MADTVLGVDVGLGKGLDLVVLDAERRIAHAERGASLGAVAAAVRAFTPALVAIDSPPAWAAAGRSRQAERDLQRLGIASFRTPAAEFATRWHAWMMAGFAVFKAVEAAYPLHTGPGDPRFRAVEVFPYATAVALRGSIPRGGTPKAVWRRAVLQKAGVDATRLRGADQVDAALAALTGVLALRGEVSWVGEPGVAVVAVPVRPLPARFQRDP